MKAEDLVKKKKLCDWLNAFVFEQRPEGDMISVEDVERGIEKCLLSPAELAGILKGDSWVLEELRKWLQEPAQESTKEALGKEMIEAMDSAFYSALNKLAHLESQAPAELAEQANRISVGETKKAEAIFSDLAVVMHVHAKNSETKEDKVSFTQESVRYSSLAELCKWFLCQKSMFDLMLEKALAKKQGGK